ncbi:type II toxin-antitoxin system RelE/ParE family toxin [Bradyrhizobium monzae]|uniref:type II toxin-antitoxin system RelE/ParE family toxin n=1 Tax=Bradyrhizobium sp. Oc8 TaxID=2876780 RepID=UPI001F2A678C|nr:type II toxin-antitoxin system RelE/ParE family toxin [Bradyrhizobium sp. Oc8]
MAEYRLSERTRADLIDIYDFTESRFGKYQAEAYYAGLIRSFGLIADFLSWASKWMNLQSAIDVSASNLI